MTRATRWGVTGLASATVVFDKLTQALVFGCSCAKIADSTCSATTIRARRDGWIRLGVFATLRKIVLDAFDRSIGGTRGAPCDRPAA